MASSIDGINKKVQFFSKTAILAVIKNRLLQVLLNREVVSGPSPDAKDALELDFKSVV
jgi:hypothetical protein